MIAKQRHAAQSHHKQCRAYRWTFGVVAVLSRYGWCMESPGFTSTNGVPLSSREPAKFAVTDGCALHPSLRAVQLKLAPPCSCIVSKGHHCTFIPMLLSWHGRVCPEPAAPPWQADSPRAGLPVLRIPSAHSPRRSERCQCGLYVRVTRLRREPVIGVNVEVGFELGFPGRASAGCGGSP